MVRIMGLLMVISSFLLFPLTLLASAYGTLAWKGRWRLYMAVVLRLHRGASLKSAERLS